MIRIFLAAMLLAAPALAQQSQQEGGKEGLAGPLQQKPAVVPQQPVPGPTPQATSRAATPAEMKDGDKGAQHTGAAGLAPGDHGAAQSAQTGAGATGAGTAGSGTSVPDDTKALAEPSQQKPAVEPQAPIPGPTPQEVSRAAKPEEKTDATKTEAQSPQTSSEAQSGTSLPPEKK